MLLQVLLIIFVALLVFRGGTLATKVIRNAKEAKREFDRTVKPVENAKEVAASAKTTTKSGALEPDEVTSSSA